MIRLALHTVLYRRGITSQSIGCEFRSMAQPGAFDVLLTQFVILSWHDALMHYAPYLQSDLFNEIRQFDSNALEANFLFVWKFAIDREAGIGKPQETLVSSSRPDMNYLARWPAPVVSAIQKADESRVKFDLPRSALDHDDESFHDDGFPATEIVLQ
jgi:hypothetical protein